MDYNHTCPCSSEGSVEGFLDCAPCPPPFMSYSDLKTLALSKLCTRDICQIARRCKTPENSEMVTDCGLLSSHDAGLTICGLTCILIIGFSIFALLVIVLIVTVYKRRTDVGNDALNVVFNDTDSEKSDRSSNIGSINTTNKCALETDHVDNQTDQENNISRVVTYEKIDTSNSAHLDVPANDSSQVRIAGLSSMDRNKINVEGSDQHIVAKL